MSLESLLASLTRNDGVAPADTTTADVSPQAMATLPEAGTAETAAAAVIRLRLTLEAEDGSRTAAILEIPRERYDGERVLEAFERHRMAGTTRIVAVRQEAPDERRHCRDCAHLRNGVCTAAKQVGAQLGYRPADDIPRRCSAFSERED